MSRFIKITLSVLLIALLNYSFQQRGEREIEVTELLGTQTVPDYYAQGIEIRQFDHTGKLKSMIKTQKLSHFPNQHQARLERPMLTLNSPLGGMVSVSAHTGAIFDSNQDIELNQGVTLSASDEQDLEKFSLITQSMNYKPQQSKLWTDHTISARSILARTSVESSSFATYHATGFQMDLNQEQITFNQDVEIHYDQ